MVEAVNSSVQVDYILKTEVWIRVRKAVIRVADLGAKFLPASKKKWPGRLNTQEMDENRYIQKVII